MCYGKHFLEVPLYDEPERAEYNRLDHENYLRDRALAGDWDIVVEGGEIRPVAKAIEFNISDFPENAMMAHVMRRAGVFGSVGEARRNGWNRPIAPGLYLVGKDKRRVLVV